MTSAEENFEKGFGLSNGDAESAFEGKVANEHIDYMDKDIVPGISPRPPRTFQAPELIRNMTPEERESAEKKLRRKIDARLMPMIVLMYIMNYLDRVCSNFNPDLTLRDLSANNGIEQHCCCQTSWYLDRFKIERRPISGMSSHHISDVSTDSFRHRHLSRFCSSATCLCKSHPTFSSTRLENLQSTCLPV